MIFRNLTVLFVLITRSLFAQTGATMSYTFASDLGVNGSLIIYAQNGNYRTEMEMKSTKLLFKLNKASIIQNSNPSHIILLNEENKTYSEKEIKHSTDSTTTTKEECLITIIGTEKVGAYNCTHVKVQQAKVKYEMWLTKDIVDELNYFTKASDIKYAGNRQLYKALNEKNVDGFIVKTVYNEKGSAEGILTMTLDKYNKGTIADEKFKIPTGFTKTTPTSAIMPAGMPNMTEIMKMTDEEREAYIKKMKEQFGVK